MSLASILDSIRGALAAALPELKTCEVVGGNVDLSEKVRRSRPLPAAFVFCAGTDDGYQLGDKVKATALFAVVLAVVARVEGQATPQDRAHQIAKLAGRAIKAIVDAKVWEDAEVEGPPKSVRSRNRYTTTADQHGLALWAITWEQDVVLLADPTPADLDDFLVAYGEFTLADGTTPAAPDAIENIELQQP